MIVSSLEYLLLLLLLLLTRMDLRYISNTLDCHRHWRQPTCIRVFVSYSETVTLGKLLDVFELQFLIAAISLWCCDNHVNEIMHTQRV